MPFPPVVLGGSVGTKGSCGLNNLPETHTHTCLLTHTIATDSQLTPTDYGYKNPLRLYRLTLQLPRRTALIVPIFRPSTLTRAKAGMRFMRGMPLPTLDVPPTSTPKHAPSIYITWARRVWFLLHAGRPSFKISQCQVKERKI